MKSETRHIFITGGVTSSLGKGLTSASLGALLEARGIRVGLQTRVTHSAADPAGQIPLTDRPDLN